MTKIVCISDTHSLHERVQIPECDILIHAGDCCNTGSVDDLKKFADWFEVQPARYKVLIAGNHDRCFERYPGLARDAFSRHCPSGIYLQDSGIELMGLKIWGSPWQPAFNGWSFNLERGAPLKAKWDLIPVGTDIIITHGPPNGFMDSNTERKDSRTQFGCKDLRSALDRVHPKLHAFGHIHGGYGRMAYNDGNGHETILLNCAICTERYYPTNQPHVIDL